MDSLVVVILPKEPLPFFHATTVQRAHWYSLYQIERTNAKENHDSFPSLSSLLCIEENVLLPILTASGLCRNTSARGSTTNMGSWENFYVNSCWKLKYH
jgi:hypothetical protein